MHQKYYLKYTYSHCSKHKSGSGKGSKHEADKPKESSHSIKLVDDTTQPSHPTG